MTEHKEGGGLHLRFWIPLLITILLSVTMATWAISERAINERAIEHMKDNKAEIKISSARNAAQDQQIALIVQKIDQQQEDLAEVLKMFKKHLGLE